MQHWCLTPLLRRTRRNPARRAGTAVQPQRSLCCTERAKREVQRGRAVSKACHRPPGMHGLT